MLAVDLASTNGTVLLRGGHDPVRLHPNEPFFSYAPVQAGPLTIEPGRTHVARYRFATVDGPPDAALFERLWRDFAAPPAVSLSR